MLAEAKDLDLDSFGVASIPKRCEVAAISTILSLLYHGLSCFVLAAIGSPISNRQLGFALI